MRSGTHGAGASTDAILCVHHVLIGAVDGTREVSFPRGLVPRFASTPLWRDALLESCSGSSLVAAQAPSVLPIVRPFSPRTGGILE